ncbi:MAG: hypothetical protein IJX08_09130 [Clostridia bacterium]|nr:hypothetical protein [Clostridia bacterium]
MRKKLFNIIKNLFFPTVHFELRTAMSSDTIKKTVQQQIDSSLSDAPFYGRVTEGDFRLTLHGRAVDRISRQRICGVIREEARGCTVEITIKPTRTEVVSRICIPLLLILGMVGAFLGISDGGLLQSIASATPFLVALVLFEVYLDRTFHERAQKATALLKELLVL